MQKSSHLIKMGEGLDKAKNLKDILSEAVERNPYEGLLFSGGLDTAILASLYPKITAITISLEAKGEDVFLLKIGYTTAWY